MERGPQTAPEVITNPQSVPLEETVKYILSVGREEEDEESFDTDKEDDDFFKTDWLKGRLSDQLIVLMFWLREFQWLNIEQKWLPFI